MYKLASSAIANRVKSILTNLIHLDQCGFMAGRFIEDNICLKSAVLFLRQKKQKKKKKGLIVLIDFQKASGSISWQFMNTCLVLYNFGEPFGQWIKLFTSDLKPYVHK